MAPTGLQPSAEWLRVATRGTALRPTSLTSPLRQASGKPCFLLFSLIFTGVRLLYDVVLVSTAQKNESFCKATLFWTSFPFRPPQCMKQFPVLCSKFLPSSHDFPPGHPGLVSIPVDTPKPPTPPMPPTPPRPAAPAETEAGHTRSRERQQDAGLRSGPTSASLLRHSWLPPIAPRRLELRILFTCPPPTQPRKGFLQGGEPTEARGLMAHPKG